MKILKQIMYLILLCILILVAAVSTVILYVPGIIMWVLTGHNVLKIYVNWLDNIRHRLIMLFR